MIRYGGRRQTAWSGVSDAGTGMAQLVTGQIGRIKASMSAVWSGIESDATAAWYTINLGNIVNAPGNRVVRVNEADKVNEKVND